MNIRTQLKTAVFDLGRLSGFNAAARRIQRRKLLVLCYHGVVPDGLRNNLRYAAPVLQQEGFPALFNIPTAYIGHGALLWPTELDLLILSTRSLADRGFCIGSHTVSHPILTTLNDCELMRELADSKAHIERELNRPCHWVGYPNGQPTDYSRQVTAATERAGYRAGFTLVRQFNAVGTSPYEMGRFCISGRPATAISVR